MPQCALAVCGLKEQCSRVSYSKNESICYNLIGHFRDDSCDGLTLSWSHTVSLALSRGNIDFSLLTLANKF